MRQPNPHAKQLIRNDILSHLYEVPFEKSVEELKALIIRNTLIGQHLHKSFTYKDSLYSCVTAPPPRVKNRLLPAIRPDMEIYLDNRDALIEEKNAVSGFLTRMLNATETLEDYLAVLPETLHERLGKTIESLYTSWPPFRDSPKRFSNDELMLFKQNNQTYSDLMKNRMVVNLII